MRIACFALILLVSSAPGYAQTQTGGQIRGIVRDSVGLPMPGVDVVVTDASAGARRATTLTDGTFVLEGLLPGTYAVAATREGFLRWTGTATLEADAPVSLTIEMRPGTPKP